MGNEKQKGKAFALLPIGVFLVIFLGAGILFKDFYAMPAVVAFLIALFVAFLQNRKVSFQKKMEVIAKGLGEENIITMCLIFLLRGSFFGSGNRSRRSGQYGEFGTLSYSAAFCSGRSVYYRMFYFSVDGNFRRNNHGACSDCGRNQ